MKPYLVVSTKQYRKDFKRLIKSGADRHKLEFVIDQLAAGIPLPDRYRDHELKGAMKGTRECHVGPDWLLRYSIDRDALILLLIRTGDHRHVLGIE